MGRAAVVLALLLVPLSAGAKLKAHYLPRGTDAHVGGVPMRCYNLEEGKTLYQMDKDLFLARKKLVLLEEKLTLSKELEDLRTKKVELADVMASSWEGEYKRLHAKWVEDNRHLHECETKTAGTEWTSTHWLVLGGEVALIVLGVALLFGGT